MQLSQRQGLRLWLPARALGSARLRNLHRTADDRGPKDHRSTRILQTMVSGIPLPWASDPECRSLLVRCFFGPLDQGLNSNYGQNGPGMMPTSSA